ncbi:MAG: ABC transporter ATP-binding protein [Acidobacteriaceae bacterium]|nr:ABC transporter ATP-binding protein [Acidobacteriaceae bacterium]
MIKDYAIEVVGLEKVYQPRFRKRLVKALSNVTLRVPAGVKFGLLGPNGAGKTTFVKILLSAVRQTAGTAQLFGRDSTNPEARRPAGYLPENHRFPTYLTANGMLDFYGALSGMEHRDRRRRVPELLDLVGLSSWGDVRIKKFSKGMLQRLGLAQALMHRPKLLLLDEPTDGVDPAGRRDIREILNRLTGTGVTIFINSHLLTEVESFCEHVAILRKGEVALEGEISSLIAGRGYRIACSHLPAAAMERIRHAGASVAAIDDGLEILVGARKDANAVLDLIRGAGGIVESMAATNSSLEDIFLRVTNERAA